MSATSRYEPTGSTPGTNDASPSAAPMATAEQKRVGGRRPRRFIAVAVVVLVVAGGVLGGVWMAWPEALGGAGADLGATSRVTRGALIISVTEDGVVKAARQKVIRNELRWAAYIEEVAPQGVIVPKGGTIIKFRCDELDEAIESQQQRVTESLNSLERAKASLAVTRKEMEYRRRTAQRGIQDAREDFARYMGEGAEDLLDKLEHNDLAEDELGKHIGAGGEAVRQLTEAEGDIQIAERDLALAQAKLDFKLKANKELAPSSPYSENEIKADRLSVDRLELAVQRAQTSKNMLLQYDIPREGRRLWAFVESAKLSSERADVEFKQNITQAEQERDAKEFIYKSDEKKYKELQEDRDQRVEIKAEENGLVVYDTGGDWRRPSDVIVDVGEKIQPRQKLMIIPDMSTLQIETRVYEAKIAQVKEKLGLESNAARALPEPAADRESIRARMEQIRQLPEAEREAAMAKLRAQVGGRRPGRRGEATSQPAGATSQPAGATSRPAGATSRPAGATARAKGAATRRTNGNGPQAQRGPEERIEAIIRLEALAGQLLSGYVHDISPMAEDKGWMSPGVKVHTAIVRFDAGQDLSRVAPNMTAKVTLILDRLDSVLKVPVAAVFSEGNTAYCWRVRNGRPEKAAIALGKTNDREVEIVSGLEEGDEVLESAPAGFQAAEPTPRAEGTGAGSQEQGQP